MNKERESIVEILENLRRMLHALGEFAKKAERLTGLTGPQLWTVTILASSSPQRVTELAKQMFLSPATIVGILDRLEVKGLVTRTRSVGDRRVVDLCLTDAGRDLAAKSPQIAQAVLVKGLCALSDEQLAPLQEGMRQIVRILGAEEIPPRPIQGASIL